MATQTTQDKEARALANSSLAEVQALKKKLTDTVTKCRKIHLQSNTAGALWDWCSRLNATLDNYSNELKRNLAGYFI